METEREELPVPTWSDLPPELLCTIADLLGLIDILSFRGVCKEWRSASTTCSAEMESASNVEPSFLVNQDDDDNFQFYYRSRDMKMYTIPFPELKGTKSLASSHGWLLMYRQEQEQSSVFFFCPFSGAKIELPPFPHSDLSDHVAAFSSPPTCPDCAVAVMNRSREVNSNRVELHLLRRGVEGWVKEKEFDKAIGKLTGAIYVEKENSFNFMDNLDNLLDFSMKGEGWSSYRIVSGRMELPLMPFSYKRAYFLHGKNKSMMKSNGGGLEDGVSISICVETYWNNKEQVLINNQSLSGENRVSQLHGTWFHPRLHSISPSFRF